MRVETADMSEEDKYTWSIRCGARLPTVAHGDAQGCGMIKWTRWPCAALGKRSYDDVCPNGVIARSWWDSNVAL